MPAAPATTWFAAPPRTLPPLLLLRRTLPLPRSLPLLLLLLLLAATPQHTMAKQQTPLGDWESPISSELITSKVTRLGAPSLLPSGDVFWMEARPSEGGRSVIVQRPAEGGAAQDVTPSVESGLNVRTRVHEYGGGEHLITPTQVFFSNFADQRVYVQDLRTCPSTATALTAEGSGQRFADHVLDAPRRRLVAVCEDHSQPGVEATNSITAIDLTSGEVTQLVTGHDFFSSPAISPDGRSLAWVAWDHPNMPWDDVLLMVGDLDEAGAVKNARQVAGGANVSVQQPQWGPDGLLYFVDDTTGWWNLYRLEQDGKAVALMPMAAEFGSPPWLFGLHTYQVLAGGTAILAVYDNPAVAGSQLGLIDVGAASITPLDTGFSSFGRLAVVEQADDGSLTVVTTAGSATRPQAVVQLKVSGLQGLASSAPSSWTVLKASSELQLDPGFLSAPQSIEFPTTGDRTAWMNYYPPANRDHELPPGELPALLVRIHGGPTSAASTLLSLSYQFWTSRGYAIADVNYGGSTGFGRDYRNRLRGNWGVVDVDDVCAAALHLRDQGLVDGKRLCIDGGSAGGYTTLACLAFRDVFSAGASHFGVADAELLAKDTHKFESRYLDLLIGPYPAEQELYRQRSPIHSADKIKAPVALFQGDEDKVVPPEQAVVMWEALKKKGLPTTLMMYKGEQHGFRKAENIRSALEGELFFYGRVLGFNATYSPELQEMVIDNLDVATS